MTEIYFIRHGESVGNRENRFRGQYDFPLNRRGLKQAHALRESLKTVNFAAIFSSPLQRALKTAEIIAGKEVPVHIENGLNNIRLGNWENRLKAEIQQKYPDLWQVWITSPEKLCYPGMETLAEVQERSITVLRKIITRHDSHTIALVSHRAVFKPLFAAMLEIPEPYFWKIHLDTASCSIAEYRKERGFTFTGINRIDHLTDYMREDLG